MPNVVFAFALYCRSREETVDTAPFETYLNGVYDVCLALQDVIHDTDWKASIALYTDTTVPKLERTKLIKKLKKLWMNGRDLLKVYSHSYEGKWPGSGGGALARFKAFKDYSEADAVIALDADLHQDTLWRRAFKDFLLGEHEVLRAVLLDYIKNPSESIYSMCACFTGLKLEALKLYGPYIGSESIKFLLTSDGSYCSDQKYLGEIAWPILRNLNMLSVQMVKWHPPEPFPESWSGKNDKVWENSQFSTLAMM